MKALLPELQRILPADVTLSVMTERTATIRASLHDMQLTLGLSIALVMLVVFLFLGRAVPTIAAGVTIPLAFAGAFVGMWALGFSLNNLTLMALAISVGFVVDDAIVVIESVIERVEAGMSPFRAAIEGAGSIGFTVIAISLSMVMAFMPLFFVAASWDASSVSSRGHGRARHHHRLDRGGAHRDADALRPLPEGEAPGRIERGMARLMAACVAGYGRSLGLAMRHLWLMIG